jgi:hypothetical protein
MIHSTKLRVVLWFDRFDKLTALRPSKGGLTTPRKIEGRRIEG